ncbi:MAG: HEAT repeat domain-containing protein [Planctomycetia bacterium]|nr:HEAT repeat domain-containing protein [Planctomycetia bacterium]
MADDAAKLDSACEALKAYNWGADKNALQPIEDAIVSTSSDAAARAALEARLIAVLESDVSRDAKDYVCRALAVIGSTASVPSLATLLTKEELSHMARFALERIPSVQAADALRAALATVSGDLKVGVLSSLGNRGDAASVTQIAAALGDADSKVAAAAAAALGSIRTPEAAKALAAAKPIAAAMSIVIDSRLACAEAFLAQGKMEDARAIYMLLVGESNPKLIRLAATRGIQTCLEQKR